MIDTICIGGAGVRGLCELGVLHHYSQTIDFNTIKHFIGTSVGASIALLLVIGYLPIEIFHYVTKIEKWIDLRDVDIINFKRDGGLVDVHTMTRHAEILVKNKLGRIPTLSELYNQTGKHITVTGVNVSKMRLEYIDHISDPHLSCIEAISLSCAIPLVFKRIIHNDCFYVDGGLTENTAVGAIRSNETALVVCVEGISHPSPDSILSYIYSLLSIPILENQRASLRQLGDRHTLVKVKLTNAPSAVDFNIDKNKRYELFCEGIRFAKQEFYILSSNKKLKLE